MSIKQRIGCVTIVILSVVFLASACFYFLLRPAAIYETNDITDYGVIKGNYDNERPKEFVFSFFPNTIEEYFSDVSYHYKTKKAIHMRMRCMWSLRYKTRRHIMLLLQM